MNRRDDSDPVQTVEVAFAEIHVIERR